MDLVPYRQKDNATRERKSQIPGLQIPKVCFRKSLRFQLAIDDRWTCHLGFVIWDLLPGICYGDLLFGIWDLEFVTWDFVIWDLEFVIWDLGFGICPFGICPFGISNYLFHKLALPASTPKSSVTPSFDTLYLKSIFWSCGVLTPPVSTPSPEISKPPMF